MVPRIAMAVGLLICAGCYHDATPAEMAASIRQTLPAGERQRSLTTAVTRGTALLITAPGLAAVHPGAGQAGFDLHAEPGKGATCGCAVAVDRRGYLATAAHLVGPDPILLVMIGDGGRATLRPARVVYRGDADFDFALLNVPGPLATAFTWSPTDALGVGTVLVAAGPNLSAVAGTARFQIEAAAGRLVEVTQATPTDACPGYRKVFGSLPTHHGDSGGPLFTLDGRLVAIHSAGRSPWLGDDWRSLAIRPDDAWLRGVIENDQRTLELAR